jgi:pyruvate dehydrogenase E2 component (dihydrolipoamide acetyltransferase)
VKVATSGLRRAIARNMVNSRMQTVPVTLTTKADATSLLAFRASLKQQNGILAPTINDIVLLLMAKALVLHPNLAAQWHESHIILPHQDGFHLGLAVDSTLGLVVPVIRNVPQLSLEVLAEQTRTLIKKARENNLQQSEISGGVFTLTNLGNFGIDHFNPVINYPECSIMGIGLIRQEAFPDTNGNVVFRPMLPLSLTFDHRIVDGAPAARFLQSVVASIEEFGKF